MPRFDSTLLKALAATLFVGAVGGFVFDRIDVPAAWLSGSMVAVALASLAGMPSAFPNRLRDGMFILLGMMMGAGVTPETVERIGDWPASMAMLALVVVAVTGATYAFLHGVAKWPRETAYFSAIPGALSFVIALASERSADLPKIAASQTVRLFFLVAILPALIVGTEPMPSLATAPATLPPWYELGAAFLACFAGSIVAIRLNVPGGWLTGAFFVSAALNASGLTHTMPPETVLIACYIGLGSMIGTRFSGTTVAMFVRLVLASIGAFVVGILVSVAGAWLIAVWLNLPFGQVLLAYAPGGLEVMTLLAFMLDLDPAFVAAHQLARYVVLVLILPAATLAIIGRAPRR
ncbi:AbrB family transcriptional regulator [Polymorphum gilvum]|uniref:Putative ammonia monooxygenase superfamily n=1 Tax=Polymorphum gilvum (strain LMG 25793 / CGMCC 1.9160 / SL003B-26A1) TaxID=991905 RepID=F2IXL3_POLGS|nr:AbrB family transcriptional regulator [Polymorphum gilvum]ADZ71635.1 Putative ammonia monooxygenase superfamily [Polymorphum gilvum SL003B-26A1]